MPKLNQSGLISQILILLLLLAGLGVGLYLSKIPQVFSPKASLGINISIVDSSGNSITNTSSTTVLIKAIPPEWPEVTNPPTPSTGAIGGQPRVVSPTSKLSVYWGNISPQPTLDDRAALIAANNSVVSAHYYYLNNDCGFNPPASGTAKAMGNCTVDLSKETFNTSTSGIYRLALFVGNSSTIVSTADVTINFPQGGSTVSQGVQGVNTTATQSIILAEDPNFTLNKQTVNFTTSPFQFTFSSATVGTKTLYVKYSSSDGREQNANPYPLTITLNANSAPSTVTTTSPTPKVTVALSTNVIQTPSCSDQKPGGVPVITAAKSGENNVTITWSKAKDPVTNYLLAYGLDPGQLRYGNPNVGDKNTTSYRIEGLSGNTKYYFQVKALNGCMPGDFSNVMSAAPNGKVTGGVASGFKEGVLGKIATSSSTASSAALITPAPQTNSPTNFIGGFLSNLQVLFVSIFSSIQSIFQPSA